MSKTYEVRKLSSQLPASVFTVLSHIITQLKSISTFYGYLRQQVFSYKCLIHKVLPMRTDSNECIKLGKPSFPQHGFLPLLSITFLDYNILYLSLPFLHPTLFFPILNSFPIPVYIPLIQMHSFFFHNAQHPEPAEKCKSKQF